MNKETVNSYIREIAYRLKDKKKYGGASVMVGAGFSKNAKNINKGNFQSPSWKELAEKMYDELYPKPIDMQDSDCKKWYKEKIIKTSGKNVTKLAEEYIVTFDRNRINRLIEESICDDLYIPGELHKKLLNFDWQDIFTTNYDTLLDRASNLIYKDNNYQLVFSANDLPGSDRPRIIKLHGSIPHIKPYIISDEDYRTYPYKYAAFVNTVQQAMLETRLCLIGFSGDDPNFQNWLGWLRDNMGENCPKIYLFGVYNNIKDPERRLLEKKEIVVIDLSVLVDNNDSNIHYIAFEKFFEEIEKYQKLISSENRSSNLYKKRPYSNIEIYKQIKDENAEYKSEYIQKMIKYSKKVYEDISPLILLPEKIRNNYAQYFRKHFNIVLKMEKSNENLILISLIIKILKKCLEILNNYEAKVLEEYIEEYYIDDLAKGKNNLKLSYIYEIIVYLLQMYRINGKYDKYNNYEAKLKICENNLIDKKNDILFEKAINHIGNFDYEKARNTLYNISEDDFTVKLRKVCMLKQISENKKADIILKECSSELAQMKLSDDLYASFSGYLNLCYRSENMLFNIEEEFSDESTYCNEYNTRNIINKLCKDINNKFFGKEEKLDKNILPFNLNTKRNTIITIGYDPLLYKSFNFILALEKLGLTTIKEQDIILVKVMDDIIESSESKYWKASIIIRSNNEKVINNFLTRETIQSMKKEDIKLLFDNLMNITNLYENDNDYFEKKYFINQKNLSDCLSRLCIYLSDDDVIKYMEYLSITSCLGYEHVKEYLVRVKSRFNNNIATKIQDIIFKKFHFKYHIASYFKSIDISDENLGEYYNNSIEKCLSSDISKRDSGIAELILLWNNKKDESYNNKMITAIYNKGNDKFPETNLYYPFIWENLPHKDEHEFSKLYYDYLNTYELVKSVEGSTIAINGSLSSVENYKYFYYAVSDFSFIECKKVTVDKPLNINILNKLYNFLDNEKTLLDDRYNIFGNKRDVELKFEEISEVVALVYFNSIDSKTLDDETLSIINKIKDFLTENNINIYTLSIIDNIKKENYDKCIEYLNKMLFLRNNESSSGIFLGIQCLLYYLEKNQKSIDNIKQSLLDILSLFKYLDIENSKSIWLNISILIRNRLFEELELQDKIAESIKDCIILYKGPAQEGKRYFMDGLYNCIKTLKIYSCQLKKRGVDLSSSLDTTIKYARSIDNEEIKNIFND